VVLQVAKWCGEALRVVLQVAKWCGEVFRVVLQVANVCGEALRMVLQVAIGFQEVYLIGEKIKGNRHHVATPPLT
jgi:hypothetical protein